MRELSFKLIINCSKNTFFSVFPIIRSIMPSVEAATVPNEETQAAPATKATIGIIYPPPEVRSILFKKCHIELPKPELPKWVLFRIAESRLWIFCEMRKCETAKW